ncbi:MAG TPA: glycosyltransferase family 1 protein [Dictyoglomaceae bacterium]|nr:glycosyltransferase family 1 protein [Dictyoglomaceae bacterium]HOL39850.1 glycosyltransferase family 1 protein [Dictyoglomaceae bacterium]HPP16355.1 glycosyltransferase family 1 protein [Dictyoglomaceae bacterium]HPU43424.1 glycosyltransferase family 1 protein [Dictyoglomaceae bacterium]
MPNLFLDARMIDASGIGTYLQNLIPFLKNQIHVTLLGDPKKIEKFLDIDDLRVIPMKSPIYSPYEQMEFILKFKDADLFWSPHFNVPIFPIKTKKRLVTIHDVFHLAFGDLYNLFERNYAKILIRSAVKLSDMIITVSNFSKSEIIKYTGIEERKIRVIYNGVDTSIFKRYEKEELEKVKEKYNLPAMFILFVGNVKPHKNLRMGLRAFELVLKNIDNLFFVIVGKKEGFIKGDREIFNLLERSKLRERVIFTGFVDKEDLPKIYNLSSLLIFPSLYEGFGLPPLEAMACGCPTVVSHLSSLPEICGDASYYVDPYDLESITEGIERVMGDENLRDTLIQKGFLRVKDFSWEKSAKEHIEAIFELLQAS